MARNSNWGDKALRILSAWAAYTEVMASPRPVQSRISEYSGQSAALRHKYLDQRAYP